MFHYKCYTKNKTLSNFHPLLFDTQFFYCCWHVMSTKKYFWNNLERAFEKFRRACPKQKQLTFYLKQTLVRKQII